MQVNITSKVDIGVKPSEIFTYLTDLKRHYLWNPHLRKVAPLNSLKLGVTYRSTSLLLGIEVRGSNKVVKYIQNREIEIANSTGTIHYRVNYKLLNNTSKTQVVCTTHVSSDHKSFAFTQPILKLLARRELQSDLEALKIAVENQLQ